MSGLYFEKGRVMNNTDKETLIRKYIDAYNSKDVAGMLACVTDDVVFRNMTGGAVNMEIYGKSSLEEIAEKTKGLFKVRNQTVKNINFMTERTRVDIRFEAVFAMTLPNGVKKGDKMKMDGYSEYDFRDGLISYIADCS